MENIICPECGRYVHEPESIFDKQPYFKCPDCKRVTQAYQWRSIEELCLDHSQNGAYCMDNDMDWEAMHTELTNEFIVREYAQMFALMAIDNKSNAVKMYQNDALFHARVCRVVADIMHIVKKYIPNYKSDKRKNKDER